MKANVLINNFVSTIDSLDKEGKNIPGLIMSHPGFGKTSTIRMYAKLHDYNLVTVIPSQSSSDDILGIQSVKDGKLVRLTPFWFNDMIELVKNGKRTILFIDELSTCDPYIQGPLLDLIFSKSLAGKKLPENIFIVAAGNYASDLDNEFKLSGPMVNRFLILNLKHSDFELKAMFDDSYPELNIDKMDNSDIENVITDKNLEVGENVEENKEFCIKKFKIWLKNSGEVTLGNNSKASEDDKNGLMGFVSLRSMNYALSFLTQYFNTYKDNSWMRIVGDTLGFSSSRSDNIPLRQVFKSYASEFKFNKKSSYIDTMDFNLVMEDFVNNKVRQITVEYIDYVNNSLKNTLKDELTASSLDACRQLIKLVNSNYSNDEKITKACQKLIETNITKSI